MAARDEILYQVCLAGKGKNQLNIEYNMTSRPASIMLENLPIMLSGISQKSSLLCPSIS